MLMFLAGLGIWASQEPMDYLATNLNPTDANAIVEQLKTKKIKYETPDPQTILVPKNLVSSLKIEIGGTGLLSGNTVDWGKLDTPGLTTTEFTQNSMHWRLKEETLAKDLREGQRALITNATVRITPANNDVFVRDKEPAKTSIQLELRSRREPPEETILALQNFIASSISGLSPEGVTIIDQWGRFLTKRKTPSNITEAQKQLQLEEEEKIVSRIKGLLEPAVGNGKVSASATVELDFDQVVIKDDTIDPRSQVERSMWQTDEKVQKRQGPLGVPGTPTNIAPADPGLGDPDIIEYREFSDSVTNYELSKKNTVTEKSPGSVKRITVSVLLDDKTKYEKDDRGRSVLQPVPWTEDEMERYRGLVAGAAGIDLARGDVVTVSNFSSVPDDPRIAEEAQRQYWIDMAKFAAPFALLFLSALVWVAYKLATRKKDLPTEEATLIHVEEIEEEVAEKVPVQTKSLEELKAEIEEEFKAQDDSQLPEVQRREVIKQRIAEIIVSDPENAASLVRTWLIEEDGGK
jgi:flagellar M-ring protein FliF